MYTNIKAFEDACTKLGLDAATVLPDFSMYPEKHRNAMTAHSKLVIIRDAVNDGWEPDWKNGKFDKWFPWFDHDSSSGSGFAFGNADHQYATSDAGSRLCFKSEDVATYVGRQFEDLYRDYFVIE
jgi:hypothetical protein